MNKLNWIRLILLTIAIAAFSTVLIPAQKAATSPSESNHPTNGSNQEVSLKEFMRLFKRNKPPLGGRGPICMATPGLPAATTETILNTQPLFLWQGKAQKIRVVSRDNQAVMWEESVAEIDRSILYRGKPLQPGQTYDWILFDINGQTPYQPDGSLAYVSFKFMEKEKRDHIKTELSNLENQLKAKGNTTEQIIMKKAYYLIQQELWSDALQVIFSGKDLSTNLTELTNDIMRYLCG